QVDNRAESDPTGKVESASLHDSTSVPITTKSVSAHGDEVTRTTHGSNLSSTSDLNAECEDLKKRRWFAELIEFEWVFFTVSFAVALIIVVVKATTGPRNRPVILNDTSIWLPHEEDTIPYYAVLVFGLVLGGGLAALTEYLHQGRSVRAPFAAARMYLCYVCTFAWVYFFTETTKLAVGELRPDFMSRCYDGVPDTYDPTIYLGVAGNSACTADDLDHINGARLSFPSGHTSTAIGFGMWLSVQWLHIACQCKNRWLDQVLLSLSFLPMAIAWTVGLSRIWDNRHHAHDVVAGALLGGTITLLCFQPVRARLTADFNPARVFRNPRGLSYTGRWCDSNVKHV
ncbi:hypothetical protein SARC_12258, partial [Sphaeroforma arctica JP610]